MIHFELGRGEVAVLGVTLTIAILWVAWFLQIPGLSPF